VLKANKKYFKREAERLVGALVAKIAARKVAARAEAKVAARAKVNASAGASSDEEVLLPAFYTRTPLSCKHGTHKTVKARFWSWLQSQVLQPFYLVHFSLGNSRREYSIPAHGRDGAGSFIMLPSVHTREYF